VLYRDVVIRNAGEPKRLYRLSKSKGAPVRWGYATPKAINATAADLPLLRRAVTAELEAKILRGMKITHSGAHEFLFCLRFMAIDRLQPQRQI